MTRKSCLALVCVIFCSSVGAVDLVKDINAASEPRSSYPRDINTVPTPVAVAGGSLLVVNDGLHGDELWISDGTPAGTRLLRDIHAGAASSGIDRFFLVNGVAYFSADDGVNGNELWRSDGTTAGTHVIANIGPGAQGAGGDYRPAAALAVAGNLLYFAASDDRGLELWRTDGTTAGTYRLKDINPGSAGSDIQQIVASGTRIYFGASDDSGFEPWTSDGTPEGTVRIADINAGTAGSGAWFDAVAGGTAFFHADDGVHGIELWRVGVNGSGASMVADINTSASGVASGTLGSQPKVFGVGNSVILTAVDGFSSTETNGLYVAGASGGATLLAPLSTDASIGTFLNVGARGAFRIDSNQTGSSTWWVTDGTVAGTSHVAALDRPQSGPDGNAAVGPNAVFFLAPSGNFQTQEIWRTDGTVAGTSKYADIDRNGYGYSIYYYDGRLYFANEAFASNNGTELWSTDGTAAGTRLFADLIPGIEGSNPLILGTSAGRLWFFARDLAAGFEPWVTDGTPAGTVRLGNLARESETGSSYPVPLGDTSAGVLLNADDGIHGHELWLSDGTPDGTRLLKDIYPGEFESYLTNATRLGNLLLFAAQDPVAGKEMWRSDGTLAGTFRVSDTLAGPASGVPANDYLPTAVMNGNVFFVAQDPLHYRALWRTDGSVAGAVPAADIPQVDTYDNLEIMGATSARVFVRQQSGQNPGTVWSTDGNPASAVRVADDVFVDNTWSVLLDGRLCFPAHQTGDAEIWCSNGTRGDMVRITDFASQGLQVVGVPQVVNDTLLVVVTGSGQPAVLAATDGTIASTRVISNRTMANIPGLSFGGGLIYETFDGGSVSLMFTDGTTAGTRPFIPLAQSLPGSVRGVPVLFGGSVVFAVEDPAAGPVLWRSDGTAGGTRYIADVDPGTDGSAGPSGFTVHGGKLLFTALRLGIGQELWALSSTSPNASDDARRGTFGMPIVADVLANDADFDGSLNPGTVEIVTAPASGTTTIDSGTGAITYTPVAGFSGADDLTYRVADNSGNFSNVAYLHVVIDGGTGGAPGAAPAPAPAPTPTPAPTPRPAAGGGGGALGIELPLLLLMLGLRRKRRDGAARS